MARTARAIAKTPRQRVPAAVAIAGSMGALSVAPRMYYDGASTGRRARGWNAPTVSPNQAVLPSLERLRDRSRLAVRNDGYAGAAIDALVTNIVGTGIKPLSKAADPDFRRTVQRVWLDWTDQSDADGLLDWYGQQAQAVRCWLEAGECFLRLRPRRPEDGLAVPLQVQVLEPEMCPHTYDGMRGNNRIRAGIEFDAIGRRVAYYFYGSRPGDLQDWDVSDLRAVPAESVIHLYSPLRAGQLRGIPQMTRALIKLHELDKYDDATLLRVQLANLFAMFIRRPASDLSVTDFNPLTGQAADDTMADGRPIVGLEPGIAHELAPGEELTFSDPPEPGGYGEFMKSNLRGACVAVGVPYEVVTGDLSAVNDRTVRVILHEFRRRVMGSQHQIVAHQLCRRVWAAWFDAAFLAGALPLPDSYATDPKPFTRVKWMPQGWPYIHPVQDVAAARDAIKSGFTSRSTVVSDQGEDSEVIDAEQAADNERADELGLKYESDGRQGKASAGPGAPGAPGAPQPAEPDEPDPAEPADPNDPDQGGEPPAPPNQRAIRKRG